MEIAFVIGILAAFLLGAYVRKPFPLWKKGEAVQTAEEKEDDEEKDAEKKRKNDEKRTENFNILMGYSVDTAKGKTDGN